MLAPIEGAYGVQFSASGGGGSSSMNIKAEDSASVNGEVSINSAGVTPTVRSIGATSLFEETHSVKDSTGKSASAYVKVTNAPSGLTYSSQVLPQEGSVSAQTLVSAEQWLTVPKADSIKCTGTASYSSIGSASVGLEEPKGAVAGDYVTLTGYYSKALASDSSVSASQTATSGMANSISAYGDANDGTGPYGVSTNLAGSFKSLSESSSAGQTTGVTQNQQILGSFAGTATKGTQMATRTSNYGTNYDLTMQSYKGSLPTGTVGYFVDSSMAASSMATSSMVTSSMAALSMTTGSVGIIQGAVNAAKSGDTINIAAGTYNENVKIDKSLALIGAGSGTDPVKNTIVDGQRSGSVFDIGAINPNLIVGLSGTRIQNGVANNGGGIWNRGAVLTVADCTISGNSANNLGGGIYNAGGSVTVTGSTLSASTLSGNSAQSGGAICSYGTGAVVSVSGSTLSGNSATQSGGAICNYGTEAKLSVSGSTLSQNSADYGGGIYNQGTATILGSSTLSGNSAINVGGGICNQGTATISGSTISGNSAYWGGGLYMWGTGNKLSVSGSTLSGNSATYGGGVYNEGINTVSISGSTISGNRATTQSGGGIYNEVPGSQLTVYNTKLIGNSANYLGGAICNEGTATISGSTLSQNTANINGGGISNSGTATVSGSTLSGNSATYGGGIFNEGTSGMLTVSSSSTLSGNSATYGGGIYNSVSATVTGSTLSGNSAVNDGGGIYNAGTSTVTDSTLSQNSAGNSGGGIQNSGNLVISGTSPITNNKATTGYGGGIYNWGGSVTFDGTGISVKNNAAHLPSSQSSWYNGWGVYLATGTPTIKNGFNSATQATGNTKI